MTNDTDELARVKIMGQQIDAVLDALLPLPKTSAPVKREPLDTLALAISFNGARGWLLVDVFGTHEGRDLHETHAQPAEYRGIEDLRVVDVAENLDLTDILPDSILEAIETHILNRGAAH